MENSQIFLKEDDVLSTPATALMYQCTFKVSEFLTIMQSKMMEEKLFSDGMDCELLSSGKAWTKGKVRVRLEFSPIDEPDVWEQKALPAATEEPDIAPEYPEYRSDETDLNDELNISDSTAIGNNFPISRYPDNDPHSVGMWS
jgi:KGK domain